MLPFLEGGQQDAAAVFEDFVRAHAEQLREPGGTCAQGTHLRCTARLNSAKHLFGVFYGIQVPPLKDSYPRTELSTPSQQNDAHIRP